MGSLFSCCEPTEFTPIREVEVYREPITSKFKPKVRQADERLFEELFLPRYNRGLPRDFFEENDPPCFILEIEYPRVLGRQKYLQDEPKKNIFWAEEKKAVEVKRFISEKPKVVEIEPVFIPQVVQKPVLPVQEDFWVNVRLGLYMPFNNSGNTSEFDEIDLHMMRTWEAYYALAQRLQKIQHALDSKLIKPNHDDKNHLLKITCGRGKHSFMGKGVLKYRVKEWLTDRKHDFKDDENSYIFHGNFLVRLVVK